jgi:hypothetical protein
MKPPGGIRRAPSAMRWGGPHCQGGSQRIGGLVHARDREDQRDASRNEPTFSQRFKRSSDGYFEELGQPRARCGRGDAQNLKLPALVTPADRDVRKSRRCRREWPLCRWVRRTPRQVNTRLSDSSFRELAPRQRGHAVAPPVRSQLSRVLQDRRQGGATLASHPDWQATLAAIEGNLSITDLGFMTRKSVAAIIKEAGERTLGKTLGPLSIIGCIIGAGGALCRPRYHVLIRRLRHRLYLRRPVLRRTRCASAGLQHWRAAFTVGLRIYSRP